MLKVYLKHLIIDYALEHLFNVSAVNLQTFDIDMKVGDVFSVICRRHIGIPYMLDYYYNCRIENVTLDMVTGQCEYRIERYSNIDEFNIRCNEINKNIRHGLWDANITIDEGDMSIYIPDGGRLFVYHSNIVSYGRKK